jgi:hypothetical protein
MNNTGLDQSAVAAKTKVVDSSAVEEEKEEEKEEEREGEGEEVEDLTAANSHSWEGRGSHASGLTDNGIRDYEKGFPFAEAVTMDWLDGRAMTIISTLGTLKCDLATFALRQD